MTTRQACRGGGRRARRAGGGGGRGGARAPRHAARQEPVARRQGGGAAPAGAGRLRRVPLRHGADHPDRAARAAPHLRRGRARPGATTCRLVRLDPQWRCFFADGTRIDLQEDVGAMARSMDAFAPGKGYGEGYRRFQDVSRTLHDVSERFFFWKPVGGPVRHHRLPRQLQPGHPARRDGAAHGPDGGQGDPRPRAGRAAGADAGPLLPVRRLQPLPRAGGAVLASATCRRARASGIPHGGTRAVAEGLAKLAATWAPSCAPASEVTGFDVENGAVVAVRDRGGERIACDAVVSNMDAIRTYRELLGGEAARALRAQALRAGLLGRGALPRPEEAATSTWRTTTSSSPATRRRSSTSSTAAASRRRTRPPTSPRRPAPTRPSRRRAARRCTCWSTRRTCGRATTGRRCSRPTAR